MPDVMPEPEAVIDDLKGAISSLEFEIEEWDRLVREAKLRVEARRDEVEGLLGLYAASLIAHEAVVDRPLLREIYWHHPAVRVKSLAAPLGVSHAGAVHQVVGPLPTERTCTDCGTALGQASRSNARSYWGAAQWCPSCADVHYSEGRESWQREVAERRREAQAAEDRVNASLQDGATPTMTLLEMPGEPGLWVVKPDGSARRAMDDDVFRDRR